MFLKAVWWGIESGAIFLKDSTWKTSKETSTSEFLGYSQHNVCIKSDTLFLAGLGLPPTKLGPEMRSDVGIALQGLMTLVG